MKVKILEKSDIKLRFDVNKINPAFANAVRRIAMSEIPVLAIKEVYFSENDSVLFDEVIAQRLGMIPMKFPEYLNLPDECECRGKGCVNCQVTFVLEKEGPCTVYSGDLKSSLEDASPLYDNIPIVKLSEGQRIKLEGLAVLGIGKNHSKWQASVCSYQYYPKITVDQKKLNEKEIKKIVDSCPKNVYKKVGNKLKVDKLEECIFAKECVKASESEAIKIEGDETRFIFIIESVSGLKPENILIKALEILEKKAKEIESKV